MNVLCKGKCIGSNNLVMTVLLKSSKLNLQYLLKTVKHKMKDLSSLRRGNFRLPPAIEGVQRELGWLLVDTYKAIDGTKQHGLGLLFSCVQVTWPPSVVSPTLPQPPPSSLAVTTVASDSSTTRDSDTHICTHCHWHQSCFEWSFCWIFNWQFTIVTSESLQPSHFPIPISAPSLGSRFPVNRLFVFLRPHALRPATYRSCQQDSHNTSCEPCLLHEMAEGGTTG